MDQLLGLADSGERARSYQPSDYYDTQSFERGPFGMSIVQKP